MRGISKFYPQSNVLANDQIDFTLERNEIHAIVGENGAGKTTLMKILYGLVRRDQGRIFLNDYEVKINSPLDADKLGIGMVHQHFRLIPRFSVAENVILGVEPVKFRCFLDRKGAVKKVGEVIDEYGFSLDPELEVSRLTVGQMQQVEILKLLYRKADILILDEPTSVLTEQQIFKLFDTIKNLTALGRTIILITHKLGEVKSVSDHITILRQGRLVAVKNTSEVDEKELSELMVGKKINRKFDRRKMEHSIPVLKFEDVSVSGKKGRRPLLDGINLTIHQGEITAVAGVGGNGLKQLEETAGGLLSATGGHIYHRGDEITNLTAFGLRKRGLAYVPADRLGRGSSVESSVLENMIISTHHSFLRMGIISPALITEFGNKLLKKFSINTLLDVSIGTLSGGNIQKVILSRELSVPSDYIIFSEPTWGLDISSSEFIYRRILECREKQMAILLISSDLDEIFRLADTIVVMYNGRIAGKFPNSGNLTKKLIGEYMLGIRDDFRKESAGD